MPTHPSPSKERGRKKIYVTSWQPHTDEAVATIFSLHCIGLIGDATGESVNSDGTQPIQRMDKVVRVKTLLVLDR